MKRALFLLMVAFPLSCGILGDPCLWVHEDKHPLNYDPAVDEDHVYFISDTRDEVLCLDRFTGKTKWIYKLNLKFIVPRTEIRYVRMIPASKSLVFNYRNKIHSLDKSDGRPIWIYSDDRLLSVPTVYNNEVYIGSMSEILVLDLETGELVKRLSVGRGIVIFIVVQDKHAFFTAISSDDEGKDRFKDLVCLDIETGETLWKRRYAANSAPIPVVDGPHVFYIDRFDNGDDVLSCLDAASGKVVWEFVHGGPIVSAGCNVDYRCPYVDADSVYASLGEDGVFRIDRATGKLDWQYQCSWASFRVAASANQVYFTTIDRIRCLDKAKGSLQWEYEVWETFHPPVIKGDHLYLADERKLIAMHIKSP